MTFKRVKGAFEVAPDEKLCIVISLGYGTTQGVAHKVKAASGVSNVTESSPAWFRRGVEAALLAPHGHEPAEVHPHACGQQSAG